MAGTARTFSSRGDAEAKVGESIEQKWREAISEKLIPPSHVSGWLFVLYALSAPLRHSIVARLLAAQRGLFLEAAMIQRIPQISFRSAVATRSQLVSKGREYTRGNLRDEAAHSSGYYSREK